MVMRENEAEERGRVWWEAGAEVKWGSQGDRSEEDVREQAAGGGQGSAELLNCVLCN